MNKNSYKKQFTAEEKKAYFENKTADIINTFFKAFESGQIVESIGLTYLRKLENIPCDRWSFRNKILMNLNGTYDARGSDQWFNVGRSLNKGCKAFYILGPVLIEKKKLKKYAKELYKMTEEEKNEKELVGFKPIPVYRVQDTNGKELQYIEKPVELPTMQFIADKFGIKLNIAVSDHKEYGSYSQTKTGEDKTITIAGKELSIFFHELSHHIHGLIEPLKNGQDTRQEVIAEFSSAVLMEIFGFKEHVDLGQTLKYIKLYMLEKDNKIVVKNITGLLNIIQKIADIATLKVQPKEIITVKNNH